MMHTDFSDEELLRYSRQILLPQIDIAGQQKLRAARVLVIGAGGLGCPVGLYLGAAGVGRLTIVDGDRVELSNLQRQIAHPQSSIGEYKAQSLAARIRGLNPQISVQALTQWVDADNVAALLAGCDLIVDCSDNFATRFLLNHHAVQKGKPLVSGAAIRGEGQLAVFRNDRVQPCYACIYPDGDEEGDTCARSGVLAPVVGVIGALQAVEALKLLTQVAPEHSYLLVYDAWQADFRRLRLRRDPACRVCGCS